MSEGVRENLGGDVEISNLDDLKRELDIQDTGDIEDLESPIKISREELNRFKEVLERENDGVRKINRLRAFIREKARITSETEQELEGLRESGEKASSNSTDGFLSGVIGTGGVETLKNGEGWFNSLKSSWDVAGKLFGEGKYVAAIGVFFSGLFGRFNLPEWEREQKEGEENGEGSEGGKEELLDGENDENLESETSGFRYTSGVSFLLNMSNFADRNNPDRVTDTGNIRSVFMHQKFKKLKYNEIKNISQNDKNGLSERLEINSRSDDEVYNAINIIKEREDIINDIIGKRIPNWKEELNIESIVLEIYNYSGFFNSLEGMDMGDLFRNGRNLLTINFESEEGPLNDILEKEIIDSKSPFYNIPKTYLHKIYNLNKDTEFTKDVFIFNNDSNEDIERFAESFVEFNENLPILMKSNAFKLGQNDGVKQEYVNFIDKLNLTPRQVLEFMIITSGETNHENLNSIQISMMFMKIFNLLNEKPTLQGETYLWAMREGIFNAGSGVEIPESVQNAIWMIIEKLWEKVKDSTWGVAQRLWGILTPGERLIGVGASIVALGGAIALMKAIGAFGWMLKGAMLGAGVMGIGQIYNYFQNNHGNNPEWIELKKDNNINNEDDFGNFIVRDIDN